MKRLLTMLNGDIERLLKSDTLPELSIIIPELRVMLKKFEVSEQGLIAGQLWLKFVIPQDVENWKRPPKIDPNFEMLDLYKSVPVGF